jgi:hypothetical protein
MALLPTNWANLGTAMQASDQNNVAAAVNANTVTVASAPLSVRAATTGSETYTLSGGSVTQIAGTTIDGVTMAVGDTFLTKDAPASSGTGSPLSTQPANGIYEITAAGSNLTVARIANMSSASAATSPAGNVAFVQNGTANAFTLWQVSNPTTPSTAFTYGTNSMAWKAVLLNLGAVGSSILPSATTTYNIGGTSYYWNNAYIENVYATALYLANGSGNTELIASSDAGGQTLTLPATATSDTLVGRASTDTLTNKTLTSPTINGATITESPTIATPTISSPTITGTPVFSSGIPKANLPNGIITFNTSLQSQATGAGTDYYITNSGLAVPASPKNGIIVGTTFLWDLVIAKNAAGTGAFSIIIYRGTNGSTSDTADETLSFGTSTAVADTMNINVMVTVTTAGSSGAYYWAITPVHQAASGAGFGIAEGALTQSGTVSSVNLSTAQLIFGIGFSVASGGTMPTVTIPMVFGQAYNLD